MRKIRVRKDQDLGRYTQADLDRARAAIARATGENCGHLAVWWCGACSWPMSRVGGESTEEANDE